MLDLGRMTVRRSTGVAVVLVCLAAPIAGASEVKAKDIIGTNGSERLVGTSRADRINALAGNDRVRSLGGADYIDAGAGNDRVLTGRQFDGVDGGPGNDRIETGPGGDTVELFRGHDVLLAGDGDDYVIVMADRWVDRIDCGAGTYDQAFFYPRRDPQDKYIGCESISRN